MRPPSNNCDSPATLMSSSVPAISSYRIPRCTTATLADGSCPENAAFGNFLTFNLVVHVLQLLRWSCDDSTSSALGSAVPSLVLSEGCQVPRSTPTTPTHTLLAFLTFQPWHVFDLSATRTHRAIPTDPTTSSSQVKLKPVCASERVETRLYPATDHLMRTSEAGEGHPDAGGGEYDPNNASRMPACPRRRTYPLLEVSCN